MKTSPKGLQLIEEFEGLELKIYKDVAGKATIGIGHLIRAGEDFSKGITKDDAYRLLATDVLIPEAYLNRYIIGSPLNQNQFDALVSFAFNLGVGSLDHLLRHGVSNLPTNILEWDHARGIREPGLTRRREAELKLWLTPVENVPIP